MTSLPEALAEWTEWDGVEFLVGKTLGLIPADATWSSWCLGKEGRKWIIWSSNPAGNALHDVIETLVKLGALERDQERTRFRWRSGFRIEDAAMMPDEEP